MKKPVGTGVCHHCKRQSTLYSIPIGNGTFGLCPVCVHDLGYYRVLYPADARLSAIKEAQEQND